MLYQIKSSNRINAYFSSSIIIMSQHRLQGTTTTLPVFATFSFLFFHPRSVARSTAALSPHLLSPSILPKLLKTPPWESNSRPLLTHTSPQPLGYSRSLRSCRRHIFFMVCSLSRAVCTELVYTIAFFALHRQVRLRHPSAIV